MTTAPANWFDAEHNCQAMGYQGHLTSIASAFERAELNAIAQFFSRNDSTNYNNNCADLWIGLSDVHLNGSYEWSDGTPYSPAAANWAPGYPRPDTGKNEYCVQSDLVTPPSQWRNVNCLYSNCYMCEATPITNTCPPAPTGSTGWHQNPANGLCYLVNLQPLAWGYSERECTNYHGNDGTPAHLVSILSADENAYVLSLAQTSLLTTSSPECDFRNGWIWLGLNNTNMWTDGNPVNYTNTVGATTGCVEMVTGNCRDDVTGGTVRAGRWSYQNCATNSLPYICKIPAPISTSPPNTGTPPSGVPASGTSPTISVTGTTPTGPAASSSSTPAVPSSTLIASSTTGGP